MTRKYGKLTFIFWRISGGSRTEGLDLWKFWDKLGGPDCLAGQAPCCPFVGGGGLLLDQQALCWGRRCAEARRGAGNGTWKQFRQTLSWYSVPRLKFNSLILEWRGCSYSLDFSPFFASFKFVGSCAACCWTCSQIGKMAWHCQSPSYRLIFFKVKKNLGHITVYKLFWIA